MWRTVSIVVLLIALTGLAFLVSEHDRRGMTGRLTDGEREHGPFPSDWFMAQRLWPDNHIDPADYLAAYEQASRLSTRALDEQPPWTNVGPTNICGRVADIVGHPTISDIFYVAAASGGIFKTVNSGQSWLPIFDNAPGQSMGALAIDGNHPETLYAGTGEANSAGFSYFGTGVYRTTNGGSSWTNVGLIPTRYISRIVVDPGNSQSIWVAALGELFITNPERGLYHSTDAGATWDRVLFVNDSTGASDVVLDPTHPQIVYAAMWQRIRNPEWRLVGGRGSGIFRSTDGGANWTRLVSGLPPASPTVGRIGLAISPSNPSVLYAVYADHPGYFAGVYRTTNGGDSWGRVNDGDLDDVFSSFGWYFGNIRVRPDNPDHVFVLGVELYRSTNGGTSWSNISGIAHVDHHALWFNPAQPQQILLGNDGGVYRSTNNGTSWRYLPGTPTIQFYAATVDHQHPERRYGGTQDNGTLRTLTGNPANWEEIYGGDGFYCLVDPTNSEVIYAEYQYGGLGRSTDGGDSWDLILSGIDDNDRRNWSTPVAMAPDNSSVLYYGTERLYRTLDRGDSWQSFSPDLSDGGGDGNLVFGTVTTIGISPVNTAVIYAGTDDANVWVTTNRGVNWQNRSAGLPNRWITQVSPDPLRANVVYVTVSGYRNAEQDAHLFMSDDYGQTWRNIASELPVGPLNDVIADPLIPHRLYVASDFGTFVTPDDGGHWMALGEDLPPVPVIDLVLHGPSRQLFAATYGRSMYGLNLNELVMNRPPEIVDFIPAELDTISASQSILFSVTATDPDTDSLSFQWTRNGIEVGTQPSVELSFTEANVRERVQVTVSDGELAVTHTWDFFVASASGSGQGIGLPETIGFMTAYPNPFNARTTIEFSVPMDEPVSLHVFDVTGREVSRLYNGRHPAGRGKVIWDANRFPSGVYWLQMVAGSRQHVHKLLLIR